MRARAVMVLGTASHVGKSLFVAGICRMLADDGYSVAPFKAQNMSLNSAPTPDGLEIGRAQAMQAEAARIAPSVDMNPILLKPTQDTASQVILLGKVQGIERAADYHRRRIDQYFSHVCAAYERLAAKHDIIVLEGAGSPAEINLKAMDLVNMRMAEAADARCLLVGDIDRGGIFAALLGTMQLLEPHEQRRIVAFAVNKFRGDLELLLPGITDFAERLSLPCAGVVPWLRDAGLDEEDGVANEDLPRAHIAWRRPATAQNRPLRIAILAIPQISNATDFAALDVEPSIDWACADSVAEIAQADVVIIPGTKTTLDALAWLQERGFPKALHALAKRGLIIGICGGFQALGTGVADPFRVEGGGARAGIGLLPVHTTLLQEKVTQRVRLTVAHDIFTTAHEIEATGYEIHMGESVRQEQVRPFCTLVRDNGIRVEDGALSQSGSVIGTYVHGLFADDALRHAIIAHARAQAQLHPASQLAAFSATREARFDRLADHLRNHLDLSHLLA